MSHTSDTGGTRLLLLRKTSLGGDQHDYPSQTVPHHQRDQWAKTKDKSVQQSFKQVAFLQNRRHCWVIFWHFFVYLHFFLCSFPSISWFFFTLKFQGSCSELHKPQARTETSNLQGGSSQLHLPSWLFIHLCVWPWLAPRTPVWPVCCPAQLPPCPEDAPWLSHCSYFTGLSEALVYRDPEQARKWGRSVAL